MRVALLLAAVGALGATDTEVLVPLPEVRGAAGRLLRAPPGPGAAFDPRRVRHGGAAKHRRWKRARASGSHDWRRRL